MKLFSTAIILLLAGCSPSIQMPSLAKQVPDTLAHDTNVVVTSETMGKLDRGTVVQTEPDNKVSVEATLQNDTKVSCDNKIIELPKNTKVTLPSNTFLIIKDSANVRLSQSTNITLDKGTVITISKINWYAVLFYIILIAGVVAYWIHTRNKDKDNDGYVDEKNSKN